jgi:hypothetical protein
LVRRVARRFGFADDVRIRLHQRAERKTPLPLEQSIAVSTILRDYLELQAPATRGQIEELAAISGALQSGHDCWRWWATMRFRRPATAMRFWSHSAP